MIKIALLGNPNSGKTTLFNKLTKSRAKVGNWAGVTVEKKEGIFNYNNKKYSIIDLPGVYSLSPYSNEEVITRDFLLSEDFDIVVNIIDSTNFERNLYLTTQLLETGKKVIVALNMVDVLESKGQKVDIKKLEKQLGCTVVPISASKGIGLDELLKKIDNHKNLSTVSTILGDTDLHKYVVKITNICDISDVIAYKLLERDRLALDYIENNFSDDDYNKIKQIITTAEQDLASEISMDMFIADLRYKKIVDIYISSFSNRPDASEVTTSDKIDKVLTHKYFGIPILLLLMYGIFSITFGPIGSFLLDTTDVFVNETVVNAVTEVLTNLNASDATISLIAGGIIPGVGMVLTFLPQILILFLFISILEDSGYMARVAFMLDSVLRKFGLNGKVFIPMITGFGCTVPAIMATRTLENEKDRKIAILITPFMSCGARLPVYLVFASIFFPNNTTFAIFTLYILGIVVALVMSLILKNSIFKGDDAPFILELPPYRAPIFINVALTLWEKAKGFLFRAGSVLLPASIFIWFLQSFDLTLHLTENIDQSILAYIGNAIAPIFTPLGFGDWIASVSLLTGLVAKEAVVSTLAILYNTGDSTTALNDAITGAFTTASAYSYMVFVLLYTPCIAAISATYREFGSLKKTLYTIVYQFGVAYIVALIIYQTALLFS